jgi:hypothetical protein
MAYLKYITQELHSQKTAPSFFREEGIKKIDIDFGYYIQRPEEKKILHSIFRGHHHIIVGNQASGKTSLVRKIGYLLERQGDIHVVLLDAGDLSLEKINEVIEEIKDAKSSFGDGFLIIMDDIHRSFEAANEIITYIINNNIKSLFSSRPSYRQYFDINKTNILLELEKKGNSFITELKAEDIQDDLIARVYESFAQPPCHSDLVELKNLSAGDLWVFGRLLNVYEEKRVFDLESMYSRTLEDLNKIGNKSSDFEKFMLEISIYGMYEIPIVKEYLYNIYSTNSIAISTKECISYQKGEYVYMYHSSLARLYLIVLCDYYRYNIKYIVSKTLSKYISHNKNEIKTIFSRLSAYPSVIDDVLDNNIALESIASFISEVDTRLLDIAELFTDICRQGTQNTSSKISYALKMIKGQIINKIDTEKSLLAISCLLNSIPWIMNSEFQCKIDETNTKILESIKSGKNENERCAYQFPVDRLNNKNNDRLISLKIKPEQMVGCPRYIDRGGAFLCLKSSMCLPSDINKEIINLINLDTLADKIREHEDLYRAALTIDLITWTDLKIGKQLYSKVGHFKNTNTIVDEDKHIYVSNVFNRFFDTK